MVAYPLDFLENLSQRKKDKIHKIRDILRCPLCKSEQLSELDKTLQCYSCQEKFSVSESIYNFLSQQLIYYGNVKSSVHVSSNDYDPIVKNIIEHFKNGLILDNGCGLRKVYYDNVVNFEIVDYPTTDVLGIGERLPFKSEVFDAVFSLAVLEHVKNPFDCAQEIIRVLKPGGLLYVVVPFLQPFHGYPDHYYNMTSSGLKNLFLEKLQILECTVPLSGLPIWCLNSFLNSYICGLPKQVADNFEQMKVSDLLNPPTEYLDKDFVRQLSPAANEELACTNSLIAVKLENQLQLNQPKREEWSSKPQPNPTQWEELLYKLHPEKTEIERLQSQLQYTQAELQQAQAELEQTQSVIKAMQTSKFWKLRKAWFKFKNFVCQK